MVNKVFIGLYGLISLRLAILYISHSRKVMHGFNESARLTAFIAPAVCAETMGGKQRDGKSTWEETSGAGSR